MKYFLTFLLVLITASTSYSQKFLDVSASDTLKYKLVKYQNEDTDTLKGQKCIHERLYNFPVVYSNKTIQDSITRFVFFFFSLPQDINAYQIDLIQRFKKYLKNEADYVTSSYDENKIEVLFNQNGFVSLSFKKVTYDGGAHAQTKYIFKNFKLDNSKQLHLNDLFVSNYYSKLEEIAEIEFYRMMELEENVNLKEEHFWFKNNKFSLNANFYIAGDGLHFFYNNYEIRAYGYGPTDLVIPWSKISHILKSKIGS